MSFKRLKHLSNNFVTYGRTDQRTDGPTDRRTKKWLIESRSTQLKNGWKGRKCKWGMKKKDTVWGPLYDCTYRVKGGSAEKRGHRFPIFIGAQNSSVRDLSIGLEI